MNIQSGGKTEWLNNKPKIEEIKIYCDKGGIGSINLEINNDSLSYLKIDEAILLRNELNNAIKEFAGV